MRPIKPSFSQSPYLQINYLYIKKNDFLKYKVKFMSSHLMNENDSFSIKSTVVIIKKISSFLAEASTEKISLKEKHVEISFKNKI